MLKLIWPCTMILSEYLALLFTATRCWYYPHLLLDEDLMIAQQDCSLLLAKDDAIRMPCNTCPIAVCMNNRVAWYKRIALAALTIWIQKVLHLTRMTPLIETSIKYIPWTIREAVMQLNRYLLYAKLRESAQEREKAQESTQENRQERRREHAGAQEIQRAGKHIKSTQERAQQHRRAADGSRHDSRVGYCCDGCCCCLWGMYWLLNYRGHFTPPYTY